MTKFYTKDYGLTAVQLEDKYSPDGDGGAPRLHSPRLENCSVPGGNYLWILGLAGLQTW